MSSSLREHPLMTSDNFWWFWTYLPTMSDNFYDITSDIWESLLLWSCWVKTCLFSGLSQKTTTKQNVFLFYLKNNFTKIFNFSTKKREGLETPNFCLKIRFKLLSIQPRVWSNWKVLKPEQNRCQSSQDL